MIIPKALIEKHTARALADINAGVPLVFPPKAIVSALQPFCVVVAAAPQRLGSASAVNTFAALKAAFPNRD